MNGSFYTDLFRDGGCVAACKRLDTLRKRPRCERKTVPTFSNPGTQVLVNVLVQRHCVWGSPKSRLARWIHNMIVTFLLTEVC